MSNPSIFASILERPAHIGLGTRVTLNPGEYAITSPGCWHIADVKEGADVPFVTAGWSTQHRPR